MLGHSNDGGATWTFTDLTPVLGAGAPSIIGVDPTNAQSVLLLFKGTTQSLALSQDGGKTVTLSMTTSGYFTSATRAPSGAIVVSGIDVSTNPVLFRSTDHGVTFQSFGNQPPHIRGMSTRGNQIYAATDEFSDGYALGVSADDGMTWQSVLSYDHVAAILGCVKNACQETCAAEVAVGLWDMSVCSADPPRDGGTTPADAGTGAIGGGRRRRRQRREAEVVVGVHDCCERSQRDHRRPTDRERRPRPAPLARPPARAPAIASSQPSRRADRRRRLLRREQEATVGAIVLSPGHAVTTVTKIAGFAAR